MAKHSIALVIVNGDQDLSHIDDVTHHLFLADMHVLTLVNRTSDEIKASVHNLIKMENPSTVLDILFVIHSEMQNRKFKTSDGELDFDRDVLDQLMSVEAFKEKFKIIVANDINNNTTLNNNDGVHQSVRYIQNIRIVASKGERFTIKLLQEIMAFNGDISEAVNESKKWGSPVKDEMTHGNRAFQCYLPKYLLRQNM